MADVVGLPARRVTGRRGGDERHPAGLTRWGLDLRQVRERLYRAPTPRERERWHGPRLLAEGWPAAKVAEWLDRDPRTIGSWLTAFCQAGPGALPFEQTGGSSPPWGAGSSQPESRGAGPVGGARRRPGQLELEGGAPLHRGPLRPPAP